MNRALYPSDWDAIALAVKVAADWRCAACGRQCRKPGEPFDTHVRTLTVAHVNHEPGDCSPENLRPLCSGCHLRYDAPEKARRRKEKSSMKKKDQILLVLGMLSFWLYGWLCGVVAALKK